MATEIPAWALDAHAAAGDRLDATWPQPLERDRVLGASDGAGVRVCVVDSGIDPGHPLVGGVARSVAPRARDDGELVVVDDDQGDVGGHGTACAGIIRSIAPGCSLTSVRVLGPDLGGSAADLLAGLSWAVDAGFDVVNLSLSTRKRAVAQDLHEILDRAYFRRTIVVACAHNLPVESLPWRFSSVVSVAGHAGEDPYEIHYNAQPPVEFHARGVDVEVAWTEGSTIRATGNSFAAPHLTGLCARVLGGHPGLTPFQLKTMLQLACVNVRPAGAP
jgi:subtilisin family serine protease